MALIYKATLSPSKLELLAGWLPTRAWFSGNADVQQLGAYRFDDPAGEVGIEAMLVRDAAGAVLHVPLTYRGAPLAGAEESLIGTTDHSVLGARWVYDGCADPIWAAQMTRTILTGGTQAEEFVDQGDGHTRPRTPSVRVRGSGTSEAPVAPIGDTSQVNCHDDGPITVVHAGGVELVVVRVLGAEVPAAHTLTGSWTDGGPALLAGLRLK